MDPKRPISKVRALPEVNFSRYFSSVSRSVRLHCVVVSRGKTALLDLMGVTSDGHIRGVFRWYDEIWQAFSQDTPSSAFFRAFQDVSNAGSLDNQVHLCGITTDGGIWH